MPISEDNTDKFFKDASDIASRNLKKVTLAVERDAKKMFDTPPEVTTRPHAITGTLARSIIHKFISRFKAIVGTNVEYGIHVELGTSKMSARPYLRPALAKNVKKLEKPLK